VLLEVDPSVDVLSESWHIPVKVQRAYSTHPVHCTLQGTTIFTLFDRMDPHRPEINATWNPCGSVVFCRVVQYTMYECTLYISITDGRGVRVELETVTETIRHRDFELSSKYYK
jgi:hypothetical protein